MLVSFTVCQIRSWMLNFVCFNRYLKELLEKGLIVEVAPDPDGIKVYKTTDKGLQLLEVLKKARDLISL